MGSEHATGDRIVILGRDRKNNPSLTQCEGGLLDFQVCLSPRASESQDQAIKPIITDNAAPTRVVQVEHQTLPRLTPCSSQQPTDPFRVQWNTRMSKRKLPEHPLNRIVPLRDAHQLGKSSHIQQQVGGTRNPCSELPIILVIEPL